MKYRHLVFYDGECGLCDRSVQFILAHDVEHLFCFAPLQGKTAQKYLKNEHFAADSLILIEDYQTNLRVTTEGDAIFAICRQLPFPIYLLSGFRWLPAFLYNGVYRWVANRRKRLFSLSCVLPDPNHPERFLD